MTSVITCLKCTDFCGCTVCDNRRVGLSVVDDIDDTDSDLTGDMFDSDCSFESVDFSEDED